MPYFFEMLVEFVEELRPNHPQVEFYTIPKLFYLLEVADKIKTRDYLSQHALYEEYNNLINSPDVGKFNRNKIEYKKFKERYFYGRRHS